MTYKPVPWDNEILKDVMNDPEAHAIYEATKLQIELSVALRKAREKRKMTQEDVAKMIRSHKPVISRLESNADDVKHFPSLLTIAKVASAVGYELKLALVPIKKKITLRKMTKKSRK